jgi:predicted AAA+ superfamily ATPase
VHVFVTGSSALQIERGRDSLAGRIATLEAGTLSLTEIGLLRGYDLGAPFLPENGLGTLIQKEFWRELVEHGRRLSDARDAVFQWFADRGAYPLVHQNAELPWEILADQLNETVIHRVIQHDLRAGRGGHAHDASLFEEVFRLACRYAGQCPGVPLFVRETQRALSIDIDGPRIHRCLRALADTLLLRLVEPLEFRLKKQRGHPKICLADHGLRASWLQELIPLSPSDLARDPGSTPLAGHLAESVVGATLATINGLDIAHLPEREDQKEIDFVLVIGARRIPIEVKYHRRIDPLRDTEGLRQFIEKSVNNAPFGLLITQTDGEPLDDPRLVRLPLATFLLLR